MKALHYVALLVGVLIPTLTQAEDGLPPAAVPYIKAAVGILGAIGALLSLVTPKATATAPPGNLP